MEELEEMIIKIEEYCVNNGIDYLFGASTRDGSESYINNSPGENNILVVASRLLHRDL